MKIIAALFLFLTAVNLSYSQSSSRNYLYYIDQLNEYSSYSAIWGYLAPNGREYAILGTFEGTSFIDVTDSANIHEVDFLPSPNPGNFGNDWREMKVFSHYAYIVSEASNSGVQIVDLQYLPDSIRYVGKLSLPNHSSTHTISQNGPYLYLNGCNNSFVSGGGIAILDLTVNPEVPVLRGKWTTRYVHDCRVVGDTIYAANIDDGNISIINAQNKDNPVTITQFLNNPNPGPHNTALTTDRKYLLVTDEINGNPRLLKIWNIQNLNNPIQAATWQPPGITTSIVHNVEVYNNLAVIAHYTAGIRILDISNPALPKQIGWYDTYPQNNGFTYNGCWGVYMFPSRKIIASDIQGGLFVTKLRPYGVITGIENPAENVYDFSLKQNYPNPFNPVTTIEFSIERNDYVILDVYNFQGRKIKSLISSILPSGLHKVNFNAENYPSGVYFYKLTVGNFSDTKKLTIIK